MSAPRKCIRCGHRDVSDPPERGWQQVTTIEVAGNTTLRAEFEFCPVCVERFRTWINEATKRS